MIKYKLSLENKFKTYKSNLKNQNLIKLTGLIMVKNQENNIIEAIKSIQSYCDYIVVVDTGSTDSTIEVVKDTFPRVTVYQTYWIENYALMRNKCLKYILTDWVLVLDADEVLNSPDCTNLDLKSFITFVDHNYENPVCTIKTKNSNSSAFVRKQILFKKSEKITYHGYVHEEIISNNKCKIDTIDTNLQVVNKGVEEFEIKKFNKPKRYSKHLLKQILNEPNNPRWVAMISQDYINLSLISSDKYLYLLRKFIFKDKVDDFTFNNIKRNKYTKYLLVRYGIFMLSINKPYKTIECCELGMSMFPYDANFVSLYLTAQDYLIKVKSQKVLKIVLNRLSAYKDDVERLNEESQGTQNSIDPYLVKILMNMSEYDNARKVAKTITDKNIKKLISKESKILL